MGVARGGGWVVFWFLGSLCLWGLWGCGFLGSLCLWGLAVVGFWFGGGGWGCVSLFMETLRVRTRLFFWLLVLWVFGFLGFPEIPDIPERPEGGESL